MIDASVAVKLVLPGEPLSRAAESLLTDTGGHETAWATPGLFDIECASAIASAVRRGRVSRDAAADGLDHLLALPVARFPMSALARAAWQLSLDLAVSVYDACYVALADVLELPLVTADEKLVQRLESTRHGAVFLGVFDEP